jgi:phosphodiesterase/alkaline phosphatase D-like protein
MWETNDDASSEVLVFNTIIPVVAKTSNYISEGKPYIINGTAGKIHKVIVSDLNPYQNYNYQVKSINSENEIVYSELCSFRTQADFDCPFSFIVTGETGGNDDDTFALPMANTIAKYRSDFLLLLGDMTYHGMRNSDWDKYFFLPFRKVLCNTPFYFCQGNHEENSPLIESLFDFKNFYSFDYGDTHFIALDSTKMIDYVTIDGVEQAIPNEGLQPDSEQINFLINDLENCESKWKIVFFHYPPYSSALYGVKHMRNLSPIFEKYNVDIVFNSHSIIYERSHPIKNGTVNHENGVIYIVVGGAGFWPESLYTRRSWHTANSLAVPHFVQVSIARNKLELQAIDVEGRLFDSIVLTK